MVQQLNVVWDSNSTESGEHTFHTHLHGSNHAEHDWKSLRPYFGWQSEKVIQDTYKVMSRFGGTIPHHDYLKNILNQEILFSTSPEGMSLLPQTLSVFSDTPAINDGSTMAQFFVGKDTLVWDPYGIQIQKQFINTLYDQVQRSHDYYHH